MGNKISPHISHREGVYSITAKRLGLNNEPTKEHLEAMGLIASKIFDILCLMWKAGSRCYIRALISASPKK